MATTTSAPRQKQLLAEAAMVIRPMISTIWLPATAAREMSDSERRGGNDRPDDDGDGDDDRPEGGSDDSAPGDLDRQDGGSDGGSGDERDVGGGFGRDVDNVLLADNDVQSDDGCRMDDDDGAGNSVAKVSSSGTVVAASTGSETCSLWSLRSQLMLATVSRRPPVESQR